jgi:hypothetical protein
LEVAMFEVSVSDHAQARAPGNRRWAPILAGVLALLGAFIVTVPAQAGYYGDSYYGYRPYSPYRYGCSACGCWRRCYSRPGLVYERRYVEREYVERRYGWPGHHYRRHYGYYPYGGYRSWSRPFPWGYGGVRYWRAPRYGWQAPYGYSRYGYEPSAESYEEPPRPPAPVWGDE